MIYTAPRRSAVRWITFPVLAPHAGGRHGYLAGTDDDRLADLNQAIADPSIDAIWCIRGGYGVTRILDRVAFQPLRDRPKAIVGYSDITALLLAAVRHAGLVTFHGPTARAPCRPSADSTSSESSPAPSRPAGSAACRSPPACWCPRRTGS
jgi:muramoyltetrapeptide carboxypeptidase